MIYEKVFDIFFDVWYNRGENDVQRLDGRDMYVTFE